MSELVFISQVGIAVYNVPLGVEKVPVLCILSMYLLLGLGTDGIFVFVNALARSYVDHEEEAWKRAVEAEKREAEDGGISSKQTDAERASKANLERFNLRRAEFGSARGVTFLGRHNPARLEQRHAEIRTKDHEAEVRRQEAAERRRLMNEQTEQSWKRWNEFGERKFRCNMKPEDIDAVEQRAPSCLQRGTQSSKALLGSPTLQRGSQSSKSLLRELSGEKNEASNAIEQRTPTGLRRATQSSKTLLGRRSSDNCKAPAPALPAPRTSTEPLGAPSQSQARPSLGSSSWGKINSSLRRIVQGSAKAPLERRRSHCEQALSGITRASHSRGAPPSMRRSRGSNMSPQGMPHTIERQHQGAAMSTTASDSGTSINKVSFMLMDQDSIGETVETEAGSAGTPLEDVSDRVKASLKSLLPFQTHSDNRVAQRASEPRENSSTFTSSPPPSPPPSNPSESRFDDYAPQEPKWIVRSKEVPATPRNLAELHKLEAEGKISLDTELFSRNGVSKLRDHLGHEPGDLAIKAAEPNSIPSSSDDAKNLAQSATDASATPAGQEAPRNQVLRGAGRMIVAARRVSAVAHESTDEVQGARYRNWHRAARKVIATERISSPAPTAVARYQPPTLDHKTEAKIVAQGLAEGGGVLTLTLTTTTVCFAAGIDSPLTVIRQFSLMQTLIMLAHCALSKCIAHIIVFLLSSPYCSISCFH